MARSKKDTSNIEAPKTPEVFENVTPGETLIPAAGQVENGPTIGAKTGAEAGPEISPDAGLTAGAEVASPGEHVANEPPAPPANEAASNAGTANNPTDTNINTPNLAIELLDVDALIKEQNLPPWQGAALCRMQNWGVGKMVSRQEFDVAIEALNNRQMGGGK